MFMLRRCRSTVIDGAERAAAAAVDGRALKEPPCVTDGAAVPLAEVVDGCAESNCAGVLLLPPAVPAAGAGVDARSPSDFTVAPQEQQPPAHIHAHAFRNGEQGEPKWELVTPLEAGKRG